eukprot:983166_1
MALCSGWSFLDAMDIIILIIALFLGCYVTYKGIQGFSQSEIKIRKRVKISYTATVIFYSLASIGFFLNLLFDHHFGNHRFLSNGSKYEQSALSLVRYAVNDATFVSYFLLMALLCNILIARLISTFGQSAYALSRCKVNLFYLISILSISILFIGFGLSGVAPLVGGGLQSLAGFSYLITSGVMVVIFVKKLNLLMLQMNDKAMNKYNTKDDKAGAKLNELQMQLINSAAKYIILTFVGFCTTLSVMLLNIVMRLAWSCVFHRVFIWIVKMDIMANLLCFYLQFRFSQSDYTKLCICLDIWLKRDMQNRTLVKMERESQIVNVKVNRDPTRSIPSTSQ